MRDAVIDRQFQHLGVDHDQPAFLGREPVEQAQDHGVDRHRLARAGGAGDQQVGHAREVHHHRVAADILAQRQRQAVAALAIVVARQQFAQQHLLALLVGQLDADHGAAGDGRDAGGQRAHRAGDVVGQADHAAGLEAGGGLQLVHGDDRAGADGDDLAAHAVIVEHGLEHPRVLLERIVRQRVAGDRARVGQQRQRRRLIGFGRFAFRLFVQRQLGLFLGKRGLALAAQLGHQLAHARLGLVLRPGRLLVGGGGLRGSGQAVDVVILEVDHRGVDAGVLPAHLVALAHCRGDPGRDAVVVRSAMCRGGVRALVYSLAAPATTHRVQRPPQAGLGRFRGVGRLAACARGTGAFGALATVAARAPCGDGPAAGADQRHQGGECGHEAEQQELEDQPRLAGVDAEAHGSEGDEAQAAEQGRKQQRLRRRNRQRADQRHVQAVPGHAAQPVEMWPAVERHVARGEDRGQRNGDRADHQAGDDALFALVHDQPHAPDHKRHRDAVGRDPQRPV